MQTKLYNLAFNAPLCSNKNFAHAKAWATYFNDGLVKLGYPDLAAKFLNWIDRGPSESTTSGIKYRKVDNCGVVAPEQLFCNLKKGGKRARGDVARAFALAITSGQDYNPDRFSCEFSDDGLKQGLTQFNRKNERKHKADVSQLDVYKKSDTDTLNSVVAALYEGRKNDANRIVNRARALLAIMGECTAVETVATDAAVETVATDAAVETVATDAAVETVATDAAVETVATKPAKTKRSRNRNVATK